MSYDLYDELIDIEHDMQLSAAFAVQNPSRLWSVVLGESGLRLDNLSESDARRLVTLFSVQNRIIQEASKNVKAIEALLERKRNNKS